MTGVQLSITGAGRPCRCGRIRAVRSPRRGNPPTARPAARASRHLNPRLAAIANITIKDHHFPPAHGRSGPAGSGPERPVRYFIAIWVTICAPIGSQSQVMQAITRYIFNQLLAAALFIALRRLPRTFSKRQGRVFRIARRYGRPSRNTRNFAPGGINRRDRRA